MIIDVHTHVWPDDDEGAWDLFVRECRANEVSLALVSCLVRGEHYPGPQDVRAANGRAKDFDVYAGDLTRWLAYINPQNENWREELSACTEDGAIGLKLWISLKDAAGNTDRTEEVIDCASASCLPVLIHTFNRTDPPLPGEFDIEEFASLAERHPNATLVGGHAGANWQHTLGVLRDRAPHALVDISGVYPQRGMLERLVKDIGAERIVFGSDMMGRSVSSQLAKVMLSDVSPEEKELILWKNAARAFRLDAVPAAPPSHVARRLAAELPDPTVDHFCFCGQWPFFETPGKTPGELNSLLDESGIRTAFTADLGSIYRFDLESANNAFLQACAGCDRIEPLAVVNPRAQNWERIVQGLDSGFAGVIVFPYLHAWSLDDSVHAPMFRALAERSTPIWVNTSLDDYRFRHAGQNCRVITDTELIAFCESAPANAYVLQGLNAAQIEMLLSRELPAAFKCEISRLTDKTGTLAKVLESGSLPNLVMGSEFPLRHIREVRWAATRMAAPRNRPVARASNSWHRMSDEHSPRPGRPRHEETQP